MSRVAIVAVMAVFVVAAVTFGQGEPGRERGFDADKVFDFESGVDTVNTFNGNLSLRIPLGSSYAISGSLSYAFALSYNVKVWDYETYGGYSRAILNRRSNVGVGWLLSLGRLIAPGDSTNDHGDWIYESPDGAEHAFWEALHLGLPATPVSGDIRYVRYTRDSTYLRLLARDENGDNEPDVIEVESSDGTVRRFDPTTGDLEQIKDRFGNSYSIDYLSDVTGTPCPLSDSFAWKITDSENARTNYVCFNNMTVHDSIYDGQVERIILAASPDPDTGSARTATYQFTYQPSSVQRGCYSNYPGDTPFISGAPMLSTVTLPDGSVFTFSYNLTAPNACESGTLSAYTLPTGATVTYEYGAWLLPVDTCLVTPGWMKGYTGIKKRTITGRGIPIGTTWTYSPLGSPPAAGFKAVCDEGDTPIFQLLPSEELITTVTDPLGNVTEYFYSTWPLAHVLVYDPRGNQVPPDPSPSGSHKSEYGMPFTRRISSDGRFLSSRVYSAAGFSANPKQSLRSIYVSYDRDSSVCLNLDSWCLEANSRMTSERVVYHDDDDRKADRNLSDFDGLGHFRTESLSGTFVTGNRITTTSWNQRASEVNPANVVPNVIESGSYPDSFVMPGVGHAWILDMAPRVTTNVTEGGVTTTAVEQRCYEPSTGFLKARRAQKASARQTSDFLTIFTRSNKGGLTGEAYFGGDKSLSAPSGPDDTLCGSADSPPETADYSLTHTYTAGLRATSKYSGSDFLSLNRQIHAASSTISSSTDSAGFVTSYTYDTSFRLTSVAPPDVAETTYEYLNAESGSDWKPARVKSTMTSSDSDLGSIESEYQYDGMGRLWRAKKLMADGSWSVRETLRNALGWTISVSEMVGIDVSEGSEYDWSLPDQTTTYLEFDPFGRPGSVTTSNGKKVTFAYTGNRTTTRTVDVATSETTETAVSITEEMDRQGRIYKVTENADGGTAAATTTYGYDAFGLSSVTMGEGTEQAPRTFTRDGRGVLQSETHPESGTTTYLVDARGHVTEQTTPVATVKFTYNSAEQLTSVKRRISATVDESISDVEYDDWGRVDNATRHNHQPSLGGDVFVKQTYTYLGPGGRVSREQTDVANGPTFTTGYGYDDLGTRSSTQYPSCSGCPGASTPARTISFDSTNGFLTSVDGYADPITYHPNGLFASIRHLDAGGANGPLDQQTIAVDGMPRPASISVTGFGICPAPDATVTGSSVVNGGVSSSASVPSIPGATYAWSITNGTITSAVNDSSITFTAGCVSPVILNVVVTASCGTASNGSKTVSVTLPSVTVSGSTTINQGTIATIQAALTGTAPWAVTWAWPGGEEQRSASSSPATFAVTPDGTTMYTVSAVSDAGGCAGSSSGSAVVTVIPPAPFALSATAVSPTRVDLAWAFAGSFTQFEIDRRSGGGAFATVGSSLNTTWSDTTAVAGVTYVYRVRAVRNGTSSLPSQPDLATTTFFADGPIVSGATMIRAAHVGELRAAVNAVRYTAGLAAATFTDPILSGVAIKTLHIGELRAALDEARAALGLSALTYTDPTLTPGTTVAKGAHVNELRGGVQ